MLRGKRIGRHAMTDLHFSNSEDSALIANKIIKVGEQNKPRDNHTDSSPSFCAAEDLLHVRISPGATTAAARIIRRRTHHVQPTGNEEGEIMAKEPEEKMRHQSQTA